MLEPKHFRSKTPLPLAAVLCNHEARTTQWSHPRTGKCKRLTGCLPEGWEQTVDEQQQVIYKNASSGQVTYTDPRLAYAVNDNDGSGRYFNRRFDASTKARQVMQGLDLNGRYVMITGATSGVGFETIKWLLMHKAHVTYVGRTQLTHEQMNVVNVDTQLLQSSQLHYIQCDLASLESVRRCAAEYLRLDWPLHVLILNAGVFAQPFSLTVDGFERTFQVNCLSHLYLLRLLKDKLIASRPARAVLVSAESHRFLYHHLDGSGSTNLNPDDLTARYLSPASAEDYWHWQAYNLSKLAMLWTAFVANQRYNNRGLTVTAVHPGNALATGLTRDSWLYRFIHALVRPYTKSMEQASASVLHATFCGELDGKLSKDYYINNCWPCKPSDSAIDQRLQQQFWEIAVSMLNDFESRNPVLKPI